MNGSYPALRLKREDVIYANCGLVPFGDSRTAAGELSFGKESRYIDHRAQGIEGLVTLIGIRYTTARGDAARALDLLLEQMPNAPARAATESHAARRAATSPTSPPSSEPRGARSPAPCRRRPSRRGCATTAPSIGRSPQLREHAGQAELRSAIRPRSRAEVTHAVRG